jgi:hypothetical protein
VNTPYFTIDELVDLFRSSRPTVTREIMSGALRADYVNGRYTVPLPDAHRYLYDNTHAPDGAPATVPDPYGPLPRLYSFADVYRLTGITRRRLEEGARLDPPRFEHIKLGRKRWLTSRQIDLLDVPSLARAA